jgi:hypothetical protein
MGAYGLPLGRRLERGPARLASVAKNCGLHLSERRTGRFTILKRRRYQGSAPIINGEETRHRRSTPALEPWRRARMKNGPARGEAGFPI